MTLRATEASRTPGHRAAASMTDAGRTGVIVGRGIGARRAVVAVGDPGCEGHRTVTVQVDGRLV